MIACCVSLGINHLVFPIEREALLSSGLQRDRCRLPADRQEALVWHTAQRNLPKRSTRWKYQFDLTAIGIGNASRLLVALQLGQGLMERATTPPDVVSSLHSPRRNAPRGRRSIPECHEHVRIRRFQVKPPLCTLDRKVIAESPWKLPDERVGRSPV